MNCFMGYNPLVAKEVKITTWIKEFDGESPSYPSFPNDGDCFVVFATDEDALSHNALSKKTYTNGDWADAEGGGGGSGDIDVASLTFVCSAKSYQVDEMPALDEESGVSIDNYLVTKDNPITVDVLLYKGIFYWSSDNLKNIDDSVMPTWSGGVDIDMETGNFVITGDGSITCAGKGIL